MSTTATKQQTTSRGTQSLSDVLGVPNVPLNRDAEEEKSKTERTSGVPNVSQKKKKDDLAAWGFLSGIGTNAASTAIISTLDDKTKEQVGNLTSAVKMVGSALGTAGFVGFALQSAFVAADLGSDVKDAAKNKKAAKALLKEGAEKSGEKLAKTTADAADKPVLEAAAKTAAIETVEAAAKPAGKSIFGKIAGGLLKGFKKVPVLGAVITGGFVVHEVAGFIGKGEMNNAFAAATAGGAEMLGNVVGFGAGDALREGTRSAFIAAGGEQFEDVAKSDIRSLVEAGVDLKNQFAQSAAQPTAAYAPVVTRGFNPTTIANG